MISTQPSEVLEYVTQELLIDELKAFDQELRVTLERQSEYLTASEQQIYMRGKKIRPILMMLSARMILGGDEPLPMKVIKGAVSLEMLHVATLIHDDIIDEAMLRRGLPSVSALRGPKEALLVGDMQFVQALRSFVDVIDRESDMALIKLVLDTTFDVCRGELDELENAFSEDFLSMQNNYLKTADRKTGVMFGLACEAGIALAGGRTHQARRGGFFGRRFGRAFQIMDDILDIIQPQNSAGKLPGVDLLQRRWSLPLIYAVEEFGLAHPIASIMLEKTPIKPLELSKHLSDLIHSNAFNRAYKEARNAVLESLFYLEPFRESQYREALESLALYIVDQPIDNHRFIQ